MEDKIKLLSKLQIIKIFEKFKELNPSPQTELLAPNPYCLLVSVVLSAQTTDKAVNKATQSLYQKVNTPEQMVALGEENLIFYIKSIGLYKNKAKHVIALSKILIQKFNSQIPQTREDLESLPGVGRKTANVILNVVYKQNVMPVDTHIFRISSRIGLAQGKTPKEIEEGLIKRIPQEYMQHAHHWLILHGRYICTARNPKCSTCPIFSLCLKQL